MTTTKTHLKPRSGQGIALGVREQFIDALLAGDAARCEAATLAALDAGAEPLQIYQDLFRPALYRVGDLWSCNRVSVAREHLATALVEQLMLDLYPRFSGLAATECKVVLATVEDELHRIGLRMTAAAFDSLGWEPIITDSGCSTDELIEVVERERPEVVGLSCSVADHFGTLATMLRRLRGRFPGLPLLLGGHAFVSGEGAELAKTEQVSLILDLQGLQDWIIAFDRPSAIPPQPGYATGRPLDAPVEARASR